MRPWLGAVGLGWAVSAVVGGLDSAGAGDGGVGLWARATAGMSSNDANACTEAVRIEA